MAKTVAFIGLGNMGGPMAANIIKAGYHVHAFDVVPGLIKTAQAAGAEPVSSAREAMDGADAVITMLPAAQHALAVWADILPAAKPGMVLIDCSTIDVESSRKLHSMAGASRCLSLDAPVSGGVSGAKAGTLTIMCGGSEEAFAAAKPFLDGVVGKRVIHCGDAGAGQAAKICNNMILGVSMIAVSEAFILAEKLGLSHQAMFDVVSTASGQCWSLTSYCPVPGLVPASPANNDYKPGFSAALMLKDLKLAQQAAAAAGAATPIGAEAAQVYALYNNAGGSGEDFSGVIRYLRGEKRGD
jgi:3-hydroxyisobutyrate dehydrogenase